MASPSIRRSRSRRRSKRQQTIVENDEKESLLSILVDFCSYTSWGGLCRVADSKYMAMKMIWLLAFMGVFGAGIYQLVGLFFTYKQRPIATHISLEHGVLLEFPSITICNYNMIRKSKLKDLPHQIRKEVEIYATKRNSSMLSNLGVQNTLKNSNSMLPTPETADAEYRISEEIAALLAKLNESQLRPLGHQFDTMILSCKYQGVNCRGDTNKSFWSTFWHFKYGNCFTFNPKLINGEEQKALTTAKTGPSDGLILEMDVEQFEYMDQLTQDAGAIFHLYPRGTMPFPFEEGINLSPGFSTSLGMRLVQINRVDRFNNNSCVNIKNKNTFYAEKYNASYTKRACVQSCLAYNQRKYCGCMEYKYQPNDKTICNMFNSTIFMCLQKVIMKAKLNQLNCSLECPPSCTGKDYKLTSSFSSWPSKNYMESFSARANINRSLSDIRENLLKVNIFYQDLNYELITEKISYQLENFVSDIGGQLGLWLGASVLSGLEIIELLILLFIHFVQKRKKKKREKNKSKSNNHEFHINSARENEHRFSGIEL